MEANIQLRMMPDIESLHEVVAIGYCTQTKEQITTVVASVKKKILQRVQCVMPPGLLKEKLPA